jgi:integrase
MVHNSCMGVIVMARPKRGSPARFRVGRVSIFLHHGTWWIYYRDGGKQVRRKIAPHRDEAEQIAAQVNAQLTTGAPTLLSFTPISVGELRQEFLAHHEHFLKSAVATIRRYRAATQHLVDFASRQPRAPQAHEIKPDAFATYLREISVAPNGHPHTRRRQLRDKGVLFILETCRAMLNFAGKRRHLPPYAGNPFATLPLGRLKLDDSKAIFVFDADSELAFLRATDRWAFPIHFVLAKTGLRVGELIHLLIEDLDLKGGWLSVRNKPGLGWRIKTGLERSIPLLTEVVEVLRSAIGARVAGPVFLRKTFTLGAAPPLVANLQQLVLVCADRQAQAGRTLSRFEALKIAQTVWRDAGAVQPEAIRNSFLRIMKTLGRPEATCPKSWRHTFATVLQDANVDPLVRQLTLGHKPTAQTGLGMTGHYTHTRPETQRQQIEQALRRWPRSLEVASAFVKGAHSC